MQQFREVLDECGFMDLGFKGFPFTWSKHWQNGSSVWERLDRVVASQEWFSDFPDMAVHHVDSTTSDHKLLWIEQADLEFRQRTKLFRFEEMWLADKGCGEIAEGVWEARVEGNEETKVLRKIATCGKELTRWSKECFGNVRNQLAKKRKELARVERQALQGGCAIRLVAIQKEINSLMDKEERMWRQRSSSLYLKEGDRNTRFFHCRATLRKCRNTISGIKNRAEEWYTQLEQITQVFIKYYKDLFTSTNLQSMPIVLNSIPQLVTEEMNSSLTNNFQAWEMEVALKQMAPLKAPGPDGMPPLFF